MKKLLEWKILNTNNSTNDYTEKFKKLLAHLKTIFGCSGEQITEDSFSVKLAFGPHRQVLRIDYYKEFGYFSVFAVDKNQLITLDTRKDTWDDILLELQKAGYIKDKKLCESVTKSVITETKEYETLWD